jgi:hypothetical protein
MLTLAQWLAFMAMAVTLGERHHMQTEVGRFGLIVLACVFMGLRDMARDKRRDNGDLR